MQDVIAVATPAHHPHRLRTRNTSDPGSAPHTAAALIDWKGGEEGAGAVLG